MSDIFRFHTIRGVEELPQAELDRLSIPTHPDNNQSAWYKMLNKLCHQRDTNGIIKLIIEHLKSGTAIHSLEQLDKIFRPIYTFVKNKSAIKTEKDKEELLRTVDLRKTPDYFKIKDIKYKDANGNIASYKSSKFDLELQSVTDTMLCLAILGKLGNKENLNYSLLFKVFHLLKLLFDKKKNVSLDEIMEILGKSTTLPACFFKLNPCSKKLEPIQITSPFAHLGIYDSTENEHYLQGDKRDTFDSSIEVNKNHQAFTENPNNPKQECECDCDESCKRQNPCCASIKPYVTDLMVVREELHCYKAKHLAYVETILLGEERIREHRHLERTEDYSERETTISKSEDKDHQVSERYSLQTETQKTIDSDLSIEAGVTANMWGPAYKVETSLDIASNNSKSQSDRIAREQAVDITERTVRKIQETARELVTKRKIVETEETNTHIFKNNTSDSKKHINGMYQFINAEYKGQVMNYGKRLMFEFILPEPLEMYKSLSRKKLDNFDLVEPESITLSPQDISDNSASNYYYLKLAKEYEIPNLPTPPIPEKIMTFSFNNDTALSSGTDYAGAQMFDVGTVPTGYKTVSMETNFWVKIHGNASIKEGWLFIAQGNIPEGYHVWNPVISEGESITGTLLYQSSCAVAGSGRIKCVRTDKSYNEWQLSVYEKLLAKYASDLQAYKAEKARYDADKLRNEKLGRNPFLNREIERTELKRMAISYISCQFYDQFTAMKRNVKPCGYPQMDLEQAEKDGKFIQFFEQLFDWNLMTYLFYPYFWGQKCDWAQKIQEDSGDPLFDKALMAGAARLQVPVKSGHEPLAMHWVTFGEIWNGTGQPPIPGSPYYISMAQEIKEQKGVFNADREGLLEVSDGSDVVKLTDSSYFWDFGSGTVDQLKINNDIDREIFIDCVAYRIVAITRTNTTDTDKWDIQIERNYKTTFSSTTTSNIKWSTGALFVGAEFMITVPTNLVYLKNKKLNNEYVTEDCLPCFPQDKCE